MKQTIELDRTTLEPFFTALYEKKLSLILLTGHMAASLNTFVDNPHRPGLQAPSEQVRQILELLKQFKLNSIDVLKQLVRFETERYALSLTTHGFRFDQLSDEEVRSIHVLLGSSFSSIHPSVQITEIVKFLKQRSYDEKVLKKLEKIDRIFDQRLLTTIRKHPYKEQIISRLLRFLSGKISLQPGQNEFDQLFNETASNLNRQGCNARDLQTYFQFRGLVPVPDQTQS